MFLAESTACLTDDAETPSNNCQSRKLQLHGIRPVSDFHTSISSKLIDNHFIASAAT